VFAKYAGGLIDGADQREYRVVKDKDIIAVLTA
jgi:co-chaperonin GroES (HSP10)